MGRLGVGVVVLVAGCSVFTNLDELRSGGGGADGSADAPIGIGVDGATCSESCPSDYAALQTDSCNCGACGHSCQGAACSGGFCQALAIAPAAATSFNGYDSAALPFVAVDSTSLYWYDASQLAVCPKTGCVKPTHLSAQLASPGPILLDDTTVYFSDGSALLACAKTGCAQPTSVLSAQPGTAVDGYALDATTAYVGIHTSTTASIVRCPKSGCVGTPQIVYNRGFQGAAGLADLLVLQGKLFWLDGFQGFADGYYAAPLVTACTLPGCSDAATFSNTNGGPPLTDGTNVYWAYGDGMDRYYLMQSPTSGSGGTFQQLLASAVGASLQGNTFYATAEFISGTTVVQRDIVSCPTSACTTWTTLATTSTSSQVVSDGAFVYWLDGGSVMRVAAR